MNGEMPYGVNTPWHPRGCRFTLQAMKTNCRRRHLTFGEFIMAVYDAYGKKAGGIVRLAVNARLVTLCRQRRIV